MIPWMWSDLDIFIESCFQKKETVQNEQSKKLSELLDEHYRRMFGED